MVLCQRGIRIAIGQEQSQRMGGRRRQPILVETVEGRANQLASQEIKLGDDDLPLFGCERPIVSLVILSIRSHDLADVLGNLFYLLQFS